MNITVGGININYITEGQGRDVVILHGWGANIASVSPIINNLKTSFKVTALDLPGFGKSEEPKEPFSVSDYSKIVKEFLEALEIKNPILIGHSNGGRIIIHLVTNFDINPRKIILIDSAGLKPPPSLKKTVRKSAFKLTKWFLTIPLWKDKSEGVLNRARAHFGSSDYKNATPVMRQTMVKLLNEDLTPLLSKIKAPTLLIWGENDTATPLRDGEIMKKNIPDSGLVILKNAGHFSYLDRPFEFSAVINNFLTPDRV